MQPITLSGLQYFSTYELDLLLGDTGALFGTAVVARDFVVKRYLITTGTTGNMVETTQAAAAGG